MTVVLGIETSCDETAAAVVSEGRDVLANVVASQHELHRRYKGVVPEIASRAHLERLAPVIDEALGEAGVGFDDIDAVAVGNRPGLVGSLMVGVSAAKAIAWSAGKPLIGVDHVRAHLYAAALSGCGGSSQGDSGGAAGASSVRYPALGLVVSGGHTSLYDVSGPTEMRLMGRTIDDAAGEAYDKAAVILDVGYPGGPKLDKLAQTGDPGRHDLPRSLLGRDSLDFSFSGLKTALLYAVRGKPRGRGASAVFERSADDLSGEQRADLAASFQAAVVDTLVMKLERALDLLAGRGGEVRDVIVGGGVSANSLLRRRVEQLGLRRGVAVHIPDLDLCVDNAAMIAGLGYHHWAQGRFDDMSLPVGATITA